MSYFNWMATAATASMPSMEQAPLASDYTKCLQYFVNGSTRVKNFLVVGKVLYYFPAMSTGVLSSLVYSSPSSPGVIHPYSNNPVLALIESDSKPLPGGVFLLNAWSSTTVQSAPFLIGNNNNANMDIPPHLRGALYYSTATLPPPEFTFLVAPDAKMVEKKGAGPVERLIFASSPRGQEAKMALQSRLAELDHSAPLLATRTRDACASNYTTLHELLALQREVNETLNLWAIVALPGKEEEALEAMLVCDV